MHLRSHAAVCTVDVIFTVMFHFVLHYHYVGHHKDLGIFISFSDNDTPLMHTKT